jgi:hypothetical protein
MLQVKHRQPNGIYRDDGGELDIADNEVHTIIL